MIKLHFILLNVSINLILTFQNEYFFSEFEEVIDYMYINMLIADCD